MNEACVLMEQRISEYIDGELDDVEKEFVRHHTANCPNCMQVLNELKILDWNLRFEDEIIAPHMELMRIHTQALDIAFQPIRQSSVIDGNRRNPKAQVKSQKQNVFKNTVRYSTKFIDYLPGTQLGNILLRQTSGLLYQAVRKGFQGNILSRKPL